MYKRMLTKAKLNAINSEDHHFINKVNYNIENYKEQNTKRVNTRENSPKLIPMQICTDKQMDAKIFVKRSNTIYGSDKVFGKRSVIARGSNKDHTVLNM